jgi:hypothetical protein
LESAFDVNLGALENLINQWAAPRRLREQVLGQSALPAATLREVSEAEREARRKALQDAMDAGVAWLGTHATPHYRSLSVNGTPAAHAAGIFNS